MFRCCGGGNDVVIGQVEGVNLTDLDGNDRLRGINDWVIVGRLLNAINSLVLIFSFTVLYAWYFLF